MKKMVDAIANFACPVKRMRSDGAEAKCRLLDAALVLFSQHGFAKTSTREIAQAAQVNIASISYYFGDKAGLYRAVLTDPRCNPGPKGADLAALEGTLGDLLKALLFGFTEPLKQGERLRHSMRLIFREMLEPTDVWQGLIDDDIRPGHKAMVTVLMRHFGLTQEDDDLHRLAFSISSLGMMLHVGSDVLSALRPGLLASPAAIDLYAQRLVGYAQAMVAHEVQRRRTTPQLPHR